MSLRINRVFGRGSSLAVLFAITWVVGFIVSSKGRAVEFPSFRDGVNLSDLDMAQDIALDPESNVIVAGYSRGRDSGRDFMVMKYDAQGRLLWLRRYDGPARKEDAATAMAVDSRGNIYVTGYSYGGETDFDYLTMKYSPDGQLLWDDRFPGR